MLKTGKFGRVGLGCMGLSGNYGSGLSDQKFIDFIKGALQQGVRIFDTADSYDETSGGKRASGAHGHNERMLGRSLKLAGIPRNQIFIASKCGFIPGKWNLDFSSNHIRQSCEDSLINLRVSYIDLYYLHRVPGKIDEFEDSLDTLAQLIREGKIGGVGLSEPTEPMIRHADNYFRSLGMPGALHAVESEFSIFSPHVLYNGILSACYELGVAFVPFSPLCRGLLTDAMTKETTFNDGDFREHLSRFQGENFSANLAMRDELKKLAVEKGCSVSQLALAWVLAHNDCTYPIPGTRSLIRLAENMDAFNVKLTVADLVRIREIVPQGAIGDRYTAEMRKAQNLPESDYPFITMSENPNAEETIKYISPTM